MGREVGAALWPERWPRDALLERCRQVGGEGSRAWEALYMQRPTPPGGGMFKRADFRYWEGAHPRKQVVIDGVAYDTGHCPVGMTIDTAQKVREEHDWTVILTFLVLGPDAWLLILDVWRERLEVPDQWPAVRNAWLRWRPDRFGIEDRGSGIGLVQQCQREGIPVEPLLPSVDKVVRAAPLSEWYRAGRVLHYAGAEWLDSYERELCGFPHVAHDDQVDAAAYARHLSFSMAPGMGRPLRARARGRVMPPIDVPEGFFKTKPTAREAVLRKYGL